MATKITSKASKRNIIGRKVKKLRKEGLLPVNLYGAKIKSQALQIPLSEFKKTLKSAGETSAVYLTIEGEKEEKPILISQVQVHPVTDQLLHADLYQVDLTQKVTVNVPVILKGESPAIAEGLLVSQQINEVEVEALPTKIPENITFDATLLKELGQMIKLSDTKLPSGAKLKVDPETTVAVVQQQKQEEEEPAAPVEGEEPAEGEEPTEGEAKEGEEPTEGEAKEGETKEKTKKEGEAKEPAKKPEASKPKGK